jgi:hypothetical protein
VTGLFKDAVSTTKVTQHQMRWDDKREWYITIWKKAGVKLSKNLLEDMEEGDVRNWLRQPVMRTEFELRRPHKSRRCHFTNLSRNNMTQNTVSVLDTTAAKRM